MSLTRLQRKFAQSGYRGLLASSIWRTRSLFSRKSVGDLLTTSESIISLDILPPSHSHQLSASRILSQYTSFEGKTVLEVGGSQSCESAYPFIRGGAASATVSGLDHISDDHIDIDKKLRIMRADALSLSSYFEPESFDMVYGLSIVEHIPSPDLFLDQVYNVLKPGGLAYFEGNPIWTSPKGHHLWVASWDGIYKGQATASYLFTEWPPEVSTNPLPDWSHLLLTQDQMREYLINESLPLVDIQCIIDWVYISDQINRLSMAILAKAYSSSKLIVLEANTHRVEVPNDIEAALRNKYGNGVDYGVCGVSYVLARP
jgi:SAM-dependent methyltransferase